VLDQLKNLPRRQLFGSVTLAIALVLCAWATLARGLFDGVMIFTGMCGVVSLGLIFLPARPRLAVEIRDGEDLDCLELLPSWSLEPFDKQAIVREQAKEALATMPEPVQPQIEQNELGEALMSLAAVGAHRMLTGTTDEELQKFVDKVETYKRDLWHWLGEVECARNEHRKVFECELRLRELGQAAADHVHLRLLFPEGFKLNRHLPEAGEQPARPAFAPGIGAFLPGIGSLRGIPRMPLQNIDPIRLPGSGKPSYSMEGETVVIDYEVGRVNQSDHRDLPSFSLRMPGAGEYTVQWEASASGLDKPTRGELKLRFVEPEEGEPVATLAGAEARDEAVA